MRVYSIHIVHDRGAEGFARRGFCTLVPSLTLGAHAQEGYGSCLVCLSVCVSVCYHSIGNIRHFYAEKEVCTGLS